MNHNLYYTARTNCKKKIILCKIKFRKSKKYKSYESKCVGNKTSRSVSSGEASRHGLEQELTQTRHSVDMVSRQLTSLTSRADNDKTQCGHGQQTTDQSDIKSWQRQDSMWTWSAGNWPVWHQELTQTRLSVDMVSRQLTSLTSDVATLSADVRHIMSVLHTRLLTSSVPGDVTSTHVSGQSSPVIAGILKSSSSSCSAAATAARAPHRVEFKSVAIEPRDLRSCSSSASLTTVMRLDDQLSVTPSRRRRQSVDMTSSRRVAQSRPSPLTADHQRTNARTYPPPASLTIPSTDL